MAENIKKSDRSISTISSDSKYDENDLQEYRDKLFTAINNQDSAEFELLLQNIELRKRLSSLNLDITENSDGLTLMQEASKVTDSTFVEGLLKLNINGNCSTENEDRPVLIAARQGNWTVLKAFRKHNEEEEA